jgi:hypothetical protein
MTVNLKGKNIFMPNIYYIAVIQVKYSSFQKRKRKKKECNIVEVGEKISYTIVVCIVKGHFNTFNKFHAVQQKFHL